MTGAKRYAFLFATLLLYLGPLLAGLAGHGWGVLPVFTLIFLCWLILLRPTLWPKTVEGWKATQPWVDLATRALVQAVLVILCLAIGRGLAGVVGHLSATPLWLPPALSLIAVGLARAAFSPAEMAEMDALLDEAIESIESVEKAAVTPPDPALGAAAEALAALPSGTSETETAEALDRLTARFAHADLLDALTLRLGTMAEPPKPALRAVVMLATDPAAAEKALGRNDQARAFQSAGTDEELLDLFARRCMLALAEEPDSWFDCPSSTSVREAADRAEDPQTAGALAALAEMIDRYAPADEDG